MDIKDENGHDYRAGDKKHCEEQIFADERRCKRRRRVDLGDQQQEDDERCQDRHPHRYFLTGVCRHVKQQHSHRADDDARQDEVDRVEKRFSSNGDVELDVRIRF